MSEGREDYCGGCPHHKGTHDAETQVCFGITKGKPCDCPGFKSEADTERERDRRLRTPWKTTQDKPRQPTPPKPVAQEPLTLSSPGPLPQTTEKPEPLPAQAPKKRGLDEWS